MVIDFVSRVFGLLISILTILSLSVGSQALGQSGDSALGQILRLQQESDRKDLEFKSLYSEFGVRGSSFLREGEVALFGVKVHEHRKLSDSLKHFKYNDVLVVAGLDFFVSSGSVLIDIYASADEIAKFLSNETLEKSILYEKTDKEGKKLGVRMNYMYISIVHFFNFYRMRVIPDGNLHKSIAFVRKKGI